MQRNLAILLAIVGFTHGHLLVRYANVRLISKLNVVTSQGHWKGSYSLSMTGKSDSNGQSTPSLREKLSSMGQAGILAYGSLNCLYYTVATGVVWTLTGRNAVSTPTTAIASSAKLSVAVSRVGKVIAGVWLGSQATKIFRLTGAVAIAPLLDRAIDYVHKKFEMSSRGKAFGAIALGLWSTFFVFYGLLVLNAFVAIR